MFRMTWKSIFYARERVDLYSKLF